VKYRDVQPSEFRFNLDDQWRELDSCIFSLRNEYKDSLDSLSNYFKINDQFSLADAEIYRGVLAKYSSKKIIEVGSGWSTAVAIDYKIKTLSDLSVTVYEPYPQRLFSIGMPDDSFAIRSSGITDLKDFSDFESLESGDILFVDSSHVVKTGSELLTIIFEIIPNLASGVLIHFHDIFNCFDYPASWIIDEKRSWNESYFLRALLQGNRHLRILIMGDSLRNHDEKRFESTVNSDSSSGSLWIQRT
jgi:hypothetical protein